MEFLKAAWDFISAPEHITAALAVIGGLKVFARYTKWTWDDKVLSVLEWPFKKIYETVTGKSS